MEGGRNVDRESWLVLLLRDRLIGRLSVPSKDISMGEDLQGRLFMSSESWPKLFSQQGGDKWNHLEFILGTGELERFLSSKQLRMEETKPMGTSKACH
jgi:hypothetical protein